MTPKTSSSAIETVYCAHCHLATRASSDRCLHCGNRASSDREARRTPPGPDDSGKRRPRIHDTEEPWAPKGFVAPWTPGHSPDQLKPR